MTKDRQKILLEALREYTESVTETQQKARQALISEGIYLDTGELAPEYRDVSCTKNS